MLLLSLSLTYFQSHSLYPALYSTINYLITRRKKQSTVNSQQSPFYLLTMSLEGPTVTLISVPSPLPAPSNSLPSEPASLSTSNGLHQQCGSYYFSFECGPEYEVYRKWLDSHHELYILAIIVYLTLIYFLKKFMADRKPMELKAPLFIWNTSIAIFSIAGSFRMVQEFIQLYPSGGTYSLICLNATDRIRAFWTFAFCLSKVVELGDTLFLVLRKRPVIFLHWYHHVTVLMFTWNACAQAAAFGRLFMLMNFTVHSFMYAYFAAQAVGIRPPKFISIFITTLQILQMIGGIFVVNHAHREISAGNKCEVTQRTMTNALLMYASYFILFVNFFLESYVFKRKSTSSKAPVEKSAKVSSNRNNMNSSNTDGTIIHNGLKSTSTLVHRNGLGLSGIDHNNNQDQDASNKRCL